MSNAFDTRPSFEEQALDEQAPLVDEALAATDRSNGGTADLQALKSEIAQLRESVRQTTRDAGSLALQEMRGKIDAQPIMAAMAVGLLAFVYGLTR